MIFLVKTTNTHVYLYSSSRYTSNLLLGMKRLNNLKTLELKEGGGPGVQVGAHYYAKNVGNHLRGPPNSASGDRIEPYVQLFLTRVITKCSL